MEWRGPPCNSWKFVHFAGAHHTGTATTVSKHGRAFGGALGIKIYDNANINCFNSAEDCGVRNDSGIEFGVGKHIQGNVNAKDGQEASANHSIFDTITGRIKLCNTESTCTINITASLELGGGHGKASISLLDVGGVSFSGDLRVPGNTNLLKDVKIGAIWSSSDGNEPKSIFASVSTKSISLGSVNVNELLVGEMLLATVVHQAQVGEQLSLKTVIFA